MRAKYALTFILALILAVGLAACDSTTTPTDDTTPAPTATS